MASVPSNLPRVPNLLASQFAVGRINRAGSDLLKLQLQLSSGQRINRPSDDAIGTSAVSVLEDIIERRDQRLRNLAHGEAVLNNVDAALGDLSNILIEAKGIASGQIGVGSDPETRRNQAQVIDAMLDELTNIANRKYQKLYLFGGDETAHAPITGLIGGLRYGGQGDGLETDLGLSRGLPITFAGEAAFGALSSRVEGQRDLDPTLTLDTRLSDVGGARGLGVALGSINVDVNGTDLAVDLTGAHRVQDVIDTLEAAIQTVDPAAVVQIDAASGNRIEIIPSAGVTVTISDLSPDGPAADLGLDTVFPAGGGTGGDLNPRITPNTLISSLTDSSGAPLTLGSIRLENLGQSRDVDLSDAVTVQDVMNLVEQLDVGVRVEINEAGDRLHFKNELSGGALSIGEVAGGTTATELGVRSLTGATALSDFNDGLGVQIRSGSVDPVTGTPDPAADLDFRITTKDGTEVDVDLTGAVTVQDVLDAINAAATTAGLSVGTGPGDDFHAGLVSDGNGLAITDTTVGGTTTIGLLNGSRAAEDLGLLGETTGATFAGEDRASVAVDSVFSHFIALRDALLADDERGITLAGEKLDADITRAAEARATVGVRTRRVTDAVYREEDLRIQDMGLKSEIKDLDFTDAATRFALLEQQLQAGLATASRATSLSLLDFLG